MIIYKISLQKCWKINFITQRGIYLMAVCSLMITLSQGMMSINTNQTLPLVVVPVKQMSCNEAILTKNEKDQYTLTYPDKNSYPENCAFPLQAICIPDICAFPLEAICITLDQVTFFKIITNGNQQNNFQIAYQVLGLIPSIVLGLLDFL